MPSIKQPTTYGLYYAIFTLITSHWLCSYTIAWGEGWIQSRYCILLQVKQTIKSHLPLTVPVTCRRFTRLLYKNVQIVQLLNGRRRLRRGSIPVGENGIYVWWHVTVGIKCQNSLKIWLITQFTYQSVQLCASLKSFFFKDNRKQVISSTCTSVAIADVCSSLIC